MTMRDGRGFAVKPILGAIALCLSMGAATPAAADQGTSTTVAYVLVSLLPGIYQTPDAKECPIGLLRTETEQYEALFPTPEARKAQRLKDGFFHNRGPNGENVHYNPEVRPDPLPFPEPVSKISLGLNLDDKVGPNDFVSPEGDTGIDNEMYRVLGCIGGWRDLGIMTVQNQVRMRDNPYNRIIFVLSDVDSLDNDNDVTIRTYRGLDNVPLDSSNKGVPGSTQRVDLKFGERFMHTFKGQIVNGVLTAGPGDYVMPWSIIGDGRFSADEQWYRAARLKLKVNSERAEGLLAGYVDVARWWRAYSKRTSAHVGDSARSTPPSVWTALQRRADAFPDATGKNTAISSAVELQFVSAKISNLPKENAKRVASAGTGH